MTDEPIEAEYAPRTRLFRLPGGVVELRNHRHGINGTTGFYFEINERMALDRHEDRGL